MLIANEYSCLKVYDSVGLKLLTTFELEDNRLWVTKFFLNHDDTEIVCCFNNGAVYLWSLDLAIQRTKFF